MLQPNDPGPITSRSPSPEENPSLKLDDNPDILKDKLREIIQTATGLFCPQYGMPNVKTFLNLLFVFAAKTNDTTNSSNEEPSPTAVQEMPYPPISNGDPNIMYPARPPLIPAGPPGFYNDPNLPVGVPPPNMPPHGSGMVGGPPQLPPNHYQPPWGPPDMHFRPPHIENHVASHPPPPHFHHGFRGENTWRPREPWRDQGRHIRGKKTAALSLLLLFSAMQKIYQCYVY